MISLYFSGTGNSKYIAEYFSRIMGAECYSIEEDINIVNKISINDTIIFCYPIHTSCVPLIMREFVAEYKPYLNEKKIIIFCTQLIFSGDGARVFTDLLKGINYTVIYAEHFRMPNNICNLFLLPHASKKQIQKNITKVKLKLNKVKEDISNGIIKKRGFNILSKLMGFVFQRFYFPLVENKAKKDVRINTNCIKCNKCTKCCPMENLYNENDKIWQKGLCTLCYRCVNICPSKAITVLVHSKVKKQYNGINNFLKNNRW